jgi:hypothetical protein
VTCSIEEVRAAALIAIRCRTPSIFAGVADECGDRIAAREYAADDLAADAAGGADHCGAHHGSFR